MLLEPRSWNEWHHLQVHTLLVNIHANCGRYVAQQQQIPCLWSRNCHVTSVFRLDHFVASFGALGSKQLPTRFHHYGRHLLVHVEKYKPGCFTYNCPCICQLQGWYDKLAETTAQEARTEMDLQVMKDQMCICNERHSSEKESERACNFALSDAFDW